MENERNIASPLSSMLSLLEDKPYGGLLQWLVSFCNMLLFKILDCTTMLYSKLSDSSQEYWIRRFCNYFLYYLEVYEKVKEKEASKQ